MPYLTFKSKLLWSRVYAFLGSSASVLWILFLRSLRIVISYMTMAFASPSPFICMWLFFFFFGLYKMKSTCWDQTHGIEGKNVRCFLQTIDDKLIVLKLVEKELFWGRREGENKGISSSTLVLLSCKLILLRGKKVARL